MGRYRIGTGHLGGEGTHIKGGEEPGDEGLSGGGVRSWGPLTGEWLQMEVPMMKGAQGAERGAVRTRKRSL